MIFLEELYFIIQENIKIKKSIFGYDLKFLSFKKMKENFYKESIYFQKSIFNKTKKKKIHLPKNYMHFS
jgi:hypothetical protein